MSNFEEWNERLDKEESLGFGVSMQLKNDAELLTDAQNLELVHKFKENWGKIYGNAGMNKEYNEGAIAADLAKICALIKPDTSEMAVDLLQTTKELFAYNKSEGMCGFELETYANQVRYLGDEKVASAYLDATIQSFSKMQNAWDKGLPALDKYVEIVNSHPELADKVVNTVVALKGKVADSPEYKESINNILNAVTKNGAVNDGVRRKAEANVFDVDKEVALQISSATENNTQQSKNWWQRLVNRFKKTPMASVDKNNNAHSGHKTGMTKGQLYSLRNSSPNQFGKDNSDKTRQKIAQIGNQVQTNSDVYTALEAYAKISAIEEMCGVSAEKIVYGGMNKNTSLDILQKAKPNELTAAIGQFKSSSEKDLPGNADFNSKVSAIIDKVPEQMGKKINIALMLNKESILNR